MTFSIWCDLTCLGVSFYKLSKNRLSSGFNVVINDSGVGKIRLLRGDSHHHCHVVSKQLDFLSSQRQDNSCGHLSAKLFRPRRRSHYIAEIFQATGRDGLLNAVVLWKLYSTSVNETSKRREKPTGESNRTYGNTNCVMRQRFNRYLSD